VEHALAQYEAQWLVPLEQGLDAIIGGRPVAVDTVVFAPLDTVYEKLLEATVQATTGASYARAPWAVLRSVLLRATMQVTLRGLAEMLQTVPAPAAILAAVEGGRWAYVSPPWGGLHNYVEPRYQFLVLPPVAATDLVALRRAATERHFGPTLVTVNTVAAGCCIVALAFFPTNKRSDVATSLYRANGTAEQPQPNEKFSASVPGFQLDGSSYDGAPVAQEVSHAA
jgi:hypothetical protein